MAFSILTDADIARLLAAVSDEQRCVFFDTSKPDDANDRSLLFTDPVAELSFSAGQDKQAFFAAAADHLAQGYHLAGWLAYEFQHPELAIAAPEPGTLLADFGVFPAPRVFDHRTGSGDLPPAGAAGPDEAGYDLTDLHPLIERQAYCDAIRTILEYIAAGDTYQVNYTFKMNFSFAGSPAALYRRLRRSQPVPYGCFMKSGERFTLSFSPELFFRVDGASITARPMKGTMRRGRNRFEDDGFAELLRHDVKNRSENVMIVDLQRNDLSRLVDDTGGGTVSVSSLFDIERYRTVLQMTSTIVAERFGTGQLSPAQVIAAIFPCGSITGAPKIRTMEIIDELETGPRGVYTGAIGYFAPDGEAVFNVPIRTLVVAGGRGEMGIGSGIVADSSPEDEWDECLLKARFLSHPPPPFELIETMLYEPRRGYLFLDDHLDRLQASADYFGFACDPAAVRARLDELAGGLDGDGCRRVRLTLSADGELTTLTAVRCEAPAALSLEDAANGNIEPVPLGFSDETVDSSSPFLFHKTTRREQYDRWHAAAAGRGLFDLICVNRGGQVTEGCITTIVIARNGAYLTPPLHCGLLDGVMRRRLLAGGGPGAVTEKILSRADVETAERIFVCNSVRGVLPARLADGG